MRIELMVNRRHEDWMQERSGCRERAPRSTGRGYSKNIPFSSRTRSSGVTGLKLCFIADGRAPSPRIWMRHLIEEGHELHLISTYPCDRHDLPVASLHVVPLDFSARVRAGMGGPD